MYDNDAGKHHPSLYTKYNHTLGYVYNVKNQFKTWTVSKPSDGFNTGGTARQAAVKQAKTADRLGMV